MSLGHMLVKLHRGLCKAVATEGNMLALAAACRALAVLLEQAPMPRLPPDLLMESVEVVPLFQCPALLPTCLWSLLRGSRSCYFPLSSRHVCGVGSGGPGLSMPCLPPDVLVESVEGVPLFPSPAQLLERPPLVLSVAVQRYLSRGLNARQFSRNRQSWNSAVV